MLKSNLIRTSLYSSSCRKNHKLEIRGCSCTCQWFYSQVTHSPEPESWGHHLSRGPGGPAIPMATFQPAGTALIPQGCCSIIPETVCGVHTMNIPLQGEAPKAGLGAGEPWMAMAWGGVVCGMRVEGQVQCPGGSWRAFPPCSSCTKPPCELSAFTKGLVLDWQLLK